MPHRRPISDRFRCVASYVHWWNLQGQQHAASSLKSQCKRQERAIEQLEELVSQKLKVG
jgi:hypothetical protein